jgi:hypothetical protein
MGQWRAHGHDSLQELHRDLPANGKYCMRFYHKLSRACKEFLQEIFAICKDKELIRTFNDGREETVPALYWATPLYDEN